MASEPVLDLRDVDDDEVSSVDGSEDGLTIHEIIEKELLCADGDCPPTFLRNSGRNLEWDYFLLNVENLKHIAPLRFFKHAPLSKIADTILQRNIFIECFNPFVKCTEVVNWIGKIVYFSGYKALVKFETFENTKARYAWMDFCSDVPKPLGYSTKNQILLFPPYDVAEKYPNFQEEMKKRFYDYKLPTITENHAKIVQTAIEETQKYKLNTVIEIIDKSKLYKNKMAQITAVVGDRLHCTYLGGEDKSGFWANCKSENLHRIGFSHTVGAELGVEHDLKSIFDPKYLPTYPDFISLEEGMLMEARHPVLTYKLSFCEVAKVLKYGYFIARFGDERDKNGVEFLFHVTSPYIFACGFSETHGIDPLIPDGYRRNKQTFSWQKFCDDKKIKPMPANYFSDREKNPFELGMKMEAVDVCRPAYVGPATVMKIADHMLLLHFDGWSRESKICYQWTDWQSPDIYPLGWSTLVGHEIQSYPENHFPGHKMK